MVGIAHLQLPPTAVIWPFHCAHRPRNTHRQPLRKWSPDCKSMHLLILVFHEKRYGKSLQKTLYSQLTAFEAVTGQKLSPSPVGKLYRR